MNVRSRTHRILSKLDGYFSDPTSVGFDFDANDFIGAYRSDSGSTICVFNEFCILVTQDGLNRIEYKTIENVTAPQQKNSKYIEIKDKFGHVFLFYDDNITNLMSVIRFILRVRDDCKDLHLR